MNQVGRISANNNDGFIELGRTFHELSKYASDEDSVDIVQTSHVGESLSWDDLLTGYRTVILAEAGAGKTSEIRNAASNLRAEGKAAFFLRLEYIPADIDLAFEVGARDQFDEWLGHSDEGWLLLDSVDEARLRHPKDFELAIRKLGMLLGSAKDRAHIVITGRTTAWRPQTDLACCVTYLPYRPTEKQPTPPPAYETEVQTAETVVEPDEKRDPEPVFKIVTLDNLTSEQVARFLESIGIVDSKLFLNAVERADAWSFTARPQDLKELAEFWLDNGRIGSRLEIMRNSIDRRLAERDQGRAESRPLAEDRARYGTRLLAAATTLSKEQTIRVPDGADNGKGIPVKQVLPDWTETDQLTLLSRPVFDEAIYGAVRFHHRSVREYLAAEWFADLLARGTSRRTIENLFFREQYGITIVTPTLRPILPWLALLDEKIRQRIIETAPEVVFEGGDPSQIPIEDRRRILRDVCEQIATGTDRRSVQDYAAVQRFANADLADDIRELVRTYKDHELRAFLLRMVWLGQITGVLPEVLEIALSPTSEIYERRTAFRALRAVGSDEDNEKVRNSFLTEAPTLNRDLLAELLEELEPTPATVEWLLAAIAKSDGKQSYSVDSLSDHVANFVDGTPLDLLEPLVEGLNRLLGQQPVVERRYVEVSQRFEWLLVPAMRAVERLILARREFALQPPSLDTIHKLSSARAYQSDEVRHDRTDFAVLLSEWPELNRAQFWFEVERSRSSLENKSERLTTVWGVSVLGGFWQFGSDDFEYAVAQIHEQTELDNRLVALSLAFDIYRSAGRPKGWRERLKRAASQNEELATQLRRYLKPPADQERRRFKDQERKWRKRREKYAERQLRERDDSRAYLQKNLETIKAKARDNPGAALNELRYLFDRSRDQHRIAGRWTEYSWRKLVDDFGEEVAQFYRDAVADFWRNNVPELRSEGAEMNKTSLSTILGLAGLEIESHEVHNWSQNLTDDEVRLACRYASFELNGFPPWFQQLFEANPQVVEDFLFGEMLYELSIETPEGRTHYLLDDVSWSGQWAWDRLALRIVDWLQINEPINLENLRMLLKIIQGSSIPDSEIAALAQQKCASLESSGNLALWYAAWTGVDPEHAIPRLASQIVAIPGDKEQTDFAMSFVTHLFGGRRNENGGARSAFEQAGHLKQLYLLMARYIRREDDIERAGTGVYSPELRDDAQDARNHLFDMLVKLPGKDAFLALSEIAAMQPERPWLQRLVKEKAEREGDIEALSPIQVRQLNDKLENTPTDHRQLADLAFMRLLDLKDDLENGDSSIAVILRAVAKETDIRKYIGRELREKAFGRYVIPQEEELADAKKPDLRFHGVGFDAPLPVELKISHRWSASELFERLENQLCGDYLRDNRSNRGIFVLVHQGKQAKWDLPEGKRKVDFEGLIAALQQRWLEISPKYSNVDDIQVIGIDLTKRDKKTSHED
ncbi:hypothetical protein [Ciceribacter ferrooxidans]|uniref:Uncharacterized protein n=1 Tax=Ciceribacter ferrooxidans TaxID=2509717 RepID=A0A4Q2T282_9HYPH|nr:hypothetical protein [Ciceribacter ferrooxidans]RYC12003.1 hypothetical protein EUU22_13135 [Ciceribacter ferrooxidans]